MFKRIKLIILKYSIGECKTLRDLRTSSEVQGVRETEKYLNDKIQLIRKSLNLTLGLLQMFVRLTEG